MWRSKESDDAVAPLKSAQASEMLMRSDLREAALGLVLMWPVNGTLISEQPLQPRGMPWWSAPLTAVYQLQSTDEGRTWSAPVVTTQARIFELGKSWREQCFLSVPIRYNGKPIEWPARCAAEPARDGKPVPR